MKRLISIFIILFITSIFAQAQGIPRKRVMLPMMKDGSPAAFVDFRQGKVTRGLALTKVEGVEYVRDLKAGFYGVMPAPQSSQAALFVQAATDQIVQTTGTFFISVQFFDEGKGAIELDYLARGPDQTVDMQTQRVFLGDSGMWQAHTFTLSGAIFDHSLPGEADFIIRNPNILIRTITLTRVPLGKTRQSISSRFRQDQMQLPPGFLFGVYPNTTQSGNLWKEDKVLREKAKLYNAWGAPQVVDTIDVGKTFLRQRYYDFSNYAERVEKLALNELTWIPRYKIGDIRYIPMNVVDALQRAQGIEDDQEGPMISLWDPRMITAYSAIISDMHKYIPSIKIPYMILSFAGDWGPLLHSSEESSNGWPDLWAGDPLAIRSYHDFLQQKYGGLHGLRTAWRTELAGWSEVQPSLMDDASVQKQLDTTQWLQNSLTEVAEQIINNVRSIYPRTKLIIEIGDEFTLSGTDVSAFVELAQANNASLVMISKRSLPTTTSSWLLFSSSCRQANVPYGLRILETPGREDMLGALYSIASDGGSLLFYNEDALAAPGTWDLYSDTLRRFQNSPPLRRIAMVYPELSLMVESPVQFDRMVGELRERFAYDMVAPADLESVHSKDYPILIAPWGYLWTQETITHLERLVRGGSALLVWTDQMWRTLEGDIEFNERLFAAQLERENGQWVLKPRGSKSNPAAQQMQVSNQWNLHIGARGDSAFLSGQWGIPQSQAAAQHYGFRFDSFRFMGRSASVTIPRIEAGKLYDLVVEGFLPKGESFRVLVGNRYFDSIEGQGEFQWTRQIRPRQGDVEIGFRGDTWSTGHVLGATQTHRVGMAVSRVALLPPNSQQMDEPIEAPNRNVAFDRSSLRETWLREVGQGITFLALAQYTNEWVFTELLDTVVTDPTILDAHYRFSFPPDGERNGILASQLEGMAVYLNTRHTPAEITDRSGRLRPILLPPSSVTYIRR